ncbi:MAG: hypothetical protein NWF04_07575 [Candidatus Bathyarchaeota archaeon]|nr:hypothetical protein [Candidatus Bathyarchaeota archaeon]
MKSLKDVHGVFKRIKHKKPTYIFCPKCASPKLELHHALDLWLTPQQYLCKECGYMGPVFMELEKEEENEKETTD